MTAIKQAVRRVIEITPTNRRALCVEFISRAVLVPTRPGDNAACMSGGCRIDGVYWATICSLVDDLAFDRRLEVHSITEIYADSGRDRAELTIKNDGHPTALANEIVADYIVEQIVKD